MRHFLGNFKQKLYDVNIFAMLATLFISIGILCVVSPVYAQSSAELTIIKKYNEMLAPTVKVKPIYGTGSGIIIYSAKRNEEWHTYILTNYHIISSSIPPKKEEGEEKEEGELEQKQNINIQWIENINIPEESVLHTNDADIIMYDEKADLALLRLQNHDSGPRYIAFLQSADTTLSVFDNVWTIGAGVGFTPFPTMGIVSNLNVQMNLKRHIQASPSIIYGNSGGGLFYRSTKHNRYEVVAIFAMVPTTLADGAITHMGLFIPTEIIREFLKKQDFDFILKEQERLEIKTRVTSN